MSARPTDLPAPQALSRRNFVKLTSAAGLLLGIQLPGCTPGADERGPDETDDLSQERMPSVAAAAAFAPNAYVRISPDNWVTVMIKFQEMGQGTATGCATLVAEELDADWARVRIEYAPANNRLYANLAFGTMQLTGGSSAMRGNFQQMRQAGAAARALLVQAAAAEWKVPESELTVEKSEIRHASGKRATFGELATRAGALPLPSAVRLKAPADFTLIGKEGTRRVDTVAKCTGTETYTIDVKLPGLLTAVIARPPSFGATLVSFDPAPALAVRGVTDVVRVPEGIAVVATGMYPAIKGRNALKVVWDERAGAALSTAQMFEDYKKLAAQPGLSVKANPNAATQLAGAAKTIEATYEFPYLAHAPMEPLNCIAWLHDGMLETWAAHQAHTIDHQNAATTAGLPQDKVLLHTLPAGGSFGRRASFWSDYVIEAVNVAKAINGRAPVRVQRTREDDMAAAEYRPQYVHRARAGVTADGKIAAWQHTVVGQGVYQARNPPGAPPRNDPSATEGLWPMPYAIPTFGLEVHLPQQVVKPLPWRSVGHSVNAFVVETMIDELASAAGQDPVDFRLALLSEKPRHTAVLKLAAEKAGWGRALPAGRARGIVMHESFASYVAMAVEVSIDEWGEPKVERAVVAVDCGLVINPDVVRAQMEGGLGFGLSAALYGEISIDKGRVEQTTFGAYRVLRINEMPRVEVHIVESQEPPTGVGEIAVPPIGPAVANALFQLTGTRVRRLPMVRPT